MHLNYCNIKDSAGALSRDFVLALRDAFGVRSFIETGTFLGDTLAGLRGDFDSLQSIELSQDYYGRAVARFAGQSQIHLINADSTTGLETALGRLSPEPALFWLDAHYSGGDTAKGRSNTPVESELRAILARPQRSDIILIDDLRYFWRVRPGFLQHDALLGYPSADDLVRFLNSGTRRYDCFAFSDALIAIPSNFRDLYVPSSLLRALTQSRKGLTVNTGLSAVERLIAVASGPELNALVEIPDYLAGQSEYGLAGHYYYWRALVHLERGEHVLARADADIAARRGVVPEGSRLAQFGVTATVGEGAADQLAPVSAGAGEQQQLKGLRKFYAALRATRTRLLQTKRLIGSFLALPEAERARILSTDPGQYVVGTKNAATRDAWVAEALAALPAGARLLDAGAGECQYKNHCGHLKYVSQDVAIYDGKGEQGLQTGNWDLSQINIVSDILDIPEPDASFDAVLCTEVLEHLADPVRALDEMGRLLRLGGMFIISAPFWSLTHFAPYHYATGFNRYFYEFHLGRLGFEIVEIVPNGNFFESMAQELRRAGGIAQEFAGGDKPTLLESHAIQILLGMFERMSAHDNGSTELLHFGYHVRAVKRPKP